MLAGWEEFRVWNPTDGHSILWPTSLWMEAEMQEYRAYIMGPDGHIQSRVDLRCKDVAEAFELAKQLVDGHDVELWQNWIDRSGRSRHTSRSFTLAVRAP
jgi:hypothetical protein